MLEVKNKIEALLFVSHKPLTASELAKLIDVKKDEVFEVLAELKNEYAQKAGGIELIELEDKYQLAAASAAADSVAKFLKTEVTGELTKPSLETLTIIAYRGPISKVELELIRGVNCSMILRNLLMRGLIESREDKTKATFVYQITMDFMKFLGINSVESLPDYSKLNRNNNLDKLLQGLSGDVVRDDIEEIVEKT